MVSGNGATVVFLEGLLTLSNVFEKVKIFEIIKSQRLRGNVDDAFGLKVFLLHKIPDKSLT